MEYKEKYLKYKKKYLKLKGPHSRTAVCRIYECRRGGQGNLLQKTVSVPERYRELVASPKAAGSGKTLQRVELQAALYNLHIVGKLIISTFERCHSCQKNNSVD